MEAMEEKNTTYIGERARARSAYTLNFGLHMEADATRGATGENRLLLSSKGCKDFL